jgi:hypothetical protein
MGRWEGNARVDVIDVSYGIRGSKIEHVRN